MRIPHIPHPLALAAAALWAAALGLSLASTFDHQIVSVGMVGVLLAGAVCCTMSLVIGRLFRREVVDPTKQAAIIGARIGARFGDLDDRDNRAEQHAA